MCVFFSPPRLFLSFEILWVSLEPIERSHLIPNYFHLHYRYREYVCPVAILSVPLRTFIDSNGETLHTRLLNLHSERTFSAPFSYRTIRSWNTCRSYRALYFNQTDSRIRGMCIYNFLFIFFFTLHVIFTLRIVWNILFLGVKLLANSSGLFNNVLTNPSPLFR